MSLRNFRTDFHYTVCKSKIQALLEQQLLQKNENLCVHKDISLLYARTLAYKFCHNGNIIIVPFNHHILQTLPNGSMLPGSPVYIYIYKFTCH